MPYRIYALFSRNDIFYVGITKGSLKSRFSCHRSQAKGGRMGSKIKNTTIRKYYKSMQIREVEVLGNLKRVAIKREQFWIKKLSDDGHRLCNTECNPKTKKPKMKIIVKAIMVRESILELVRENKEQPPYTPISKFVETAILEKLKKSK